MSNKNEYWRVEVGEYGMTWSVYGRRRFETRDDALWFANYLRLVKREMWVRVVRIQSSVEPET